MDPSAPEDLDSARADAGLTRGELWLRYFGLGGSIPALEFDAILHRMLTPADHDRNQIAHALNERFVEIGSSRRLPYRRAPGDAG